MADFMPALNFLLDNEDRNRDYAVVPDAGGFSISGVNSKAFPTAYIGLSEIPQDQRAPHVARFYQAEFWNPMLLADLDSQDLANRVLDAGVNMGQRPAVILLQKAIGAIGMPGVVVDGRMGPQTTGAANACDQGHLLTSFRLLRVDHYRAIVAANPGDQRYLAAWLARASA